MKKSVWFAGGMALCLVGVAITAVSALTYRVQWGDTLFRLAARFNTSVAAIVQANQIANPDRIFVDQLLEIPIDGPTPVPTVPPTPKPGDPPGAPTTYVVRTGDTLFSIARRFATTVTAIAQANNIVNINLIRVGQVLVIPGGNADPPPAGEARFELGGQSNNLANRERMVAAGMTWVKIQVKWQPGDIPDVVAGHIQDAHLHEFKILLSITGAEAYPAAGGIDFGAYVDFVRGVAALGPDAIEIWNEMNIDFEWPAGEIRPATYVRQMLVPAYRAIKAADADVMVISGALAPTGFDNGHNAWSDSRYLAGMWASGAANFLDCIGVHHNAGATSPNATTGHPGGSHYSWYFRPTLDLYYNTFARSRKICFTELGYLSGEGFEGLPPNFSWAIGTSVAEQSQWLAQVADLSGNSNQIRLVIIYNVNFTKYDPNGDPQAGYAIIRPDGSCPACETLREVMK